MRQQSASTDSFTSCFILEVRWEPTLEGSTIKQPRKKLSASSAERGNNYCVHSEGLTFVITGAENRGEIISRGFLMLFKDELIISLRQSKVRQATGAPRRDETPSKGLKVKELCWVLQRGTRQPPKRRVCFIIA